MIKYLIQLDAFLSHLGEESDGIFGAAGPLQLKTLDKERVGDGLHDTSFGQAEILAGRTELFDQVDGPRKAAVFQPELLLLEAAVFDAAGQIVETLPFDDERQNQFEIGRHSARIAGRFRFADPGVVAHVQLANLVGNAAGFESFG